MKNIFEKQIDGVKFSFETVEYSGKKGYRVRFEVEKLNYELRFHKINDEWQLQPDSTNLPVGLSQYSSKIIAVIHQNEL